MRTLYKSAPWAAEAISPARPFTFISHRPHRIGTPADTFSPARFSPRRAGLEQAGAGKPIEGGNLTVPICLCEYMSSMGQSCAKPTAGGTGGSAEFGSDSGGGSKGGGTIITIAVAGGVGVAILALLGVI